MADQVTYAGRLIGVDGTRAKDVNAAADAIVTSLKAKGVDCAVSRWDASGLFTDLAASAHDRNVSVRSLSLVYAADLAFRLRWEIRPVLEAGGVIIAAPYIETVVAFGGSCGLDEQWIRQLLRFAPRPAIHGRAEERKTHRPWKRRTDRGYCEFASVILDVSAPKRASHAARRVMISKLDHPRGHKAIELGGKGIDRVVKKITGRKPAAATQRPSRPRSGRK
jgi:hypothetical protein